MQRELLIRNRFSDDDIYFIIMKRLDFIILNDLTKTQIIENILNLRDELDRFT